LPVVFIPVTELFDFGITVTAVPACRPLLPQQTPGDPSFYLPKSRRALCPIDHGLGTKEFSIPVDSPLLWPFPLSTPPPFFFFPLGVNFYLFGPLLPRSKGARIWLQGLFLLIPLLPWSRYFTCRRDSTPLPPSTGNFYFRRFLLSFSFYPEGHPFLIGASPNFSLSSPEYIRLLPLSRRRVKLSPWESAFVPPVFPPLDLSYLSSELLVRQSCKCFQSGLFLFPLPHLSTYTYIFFVPLPL